MKLEKCNRSRSAAGSTLVVTLVITVIIGFSLAGYLDLIRQQNLSVVRSERWNGGISVLEAGVEEALTHLFFNATNRATEGWKLEDDVYVKERYLGDNKYLVTISKDTRPTIIARAYMREPRGTNFLYPPRAVKVTLTNSPLFAKGMVAKGQIDLSGNKITTDSFDSSDPNYSTGGMYDAAKRKDNGDVATNSSVIDTLDVWNAEIYGTAATGPGGNVLLGQNGAVGTKAWIDGGTKGIEPGRSNDDMNVHFRDVTLPFSGGALTPASGIVDGVNYKYVITSGNWQLDNLKLSGSEQMLVTGSAVLLVTTDLSLSGTSSIKIAPDSTLQLYVSAPTASIAGNGVANTAGKAENFYYYGLPSNTKIALGGNAAFIGAIYAPQAALSMGGGGSDTYDFMGASVSASVKLNGKYQFHYDEGLATVGPRRGFTVESWDEVLAADVWSWSEL